MTTLKPKAVIGTLPLFEQKAATELVINHVMGVSQRDTNFLNLGQTLVTGFDQPLYAIGKQLQ